MKIDEAPRTRRYSMATRGEAAAQNSARILETTLELYWQHPIEDITLAMIAERSGVTVQTVIRKFGGRDDVLTAAAKRTAEAIESQRNEAPVGDRDAIVAVLVEHYEQIGDGVMKLLSEEARLPAIAEIVTRGRALHRDWCERVFTPQLAAVSAARRPRLLRQLVVICDVYTWKLLRRDADLTREETAKTISGMIRAMESESR